LESPPPLNNFRANSILAIPQPDKVRICINVSLPKDSNLKDNVKKFELEKVEMTSAKLFSFTILECGIGSKMWKFDFQDAYKNVPVPLSDLRLQGFRWLGAYFVELKQMFGAAASVQNFDILGNTIKSCSLAQCQIPRKLVHRQLDDVPVVVPKHSSWCTEFENVYRNLCSKLNVKLASDCPMFEKAFSNSTFGKVLGIFFNTENLTWSLPKEKTAKCLLSIFNVESKNSVTLLDMQQLMGNLNHVAQMAPFLSNFRFNLNKTLACCISAEPVLLSDEALQELNVWRNFLLDDRGWWPICRLQQAPPICTKVFFTDAAGLPRNTTWKDNIGCGVIGVDEVLDTILAYQFWWPKDFISFARDSKNCRFGEKSSTLEMIALILPFVLIPELLTEQHIVFRTDNLSCVYGLQNRLMKGDETASIFIRSVHLICAYLGSALHAEHTPRCSDWGSSVADSLSRKSTTGFLEQRMLSRWKHINLPEVIDSWLNNPTDDWDLPFKLLKFVEEKTNK
jgi:hypothetical protein